MSACSNCNTWSDFLDFARGQCSKQSFNNWLGNIRLLKASDDFIELEVPNIFVQNYLIDNYGEDLRSFVPLTADGKLAIRFVIAENKKSVIKKESVYPGVSEAPQENLPEDFVCKLNTSYRFDNFIEGPSNQFVKSVATGIAAKPGLSYNPLFIHGGVGLGKTHLLHAIGHYINENHKKLRIHCITTESFINSLVDHLRAKSVDKMKKFYRSLDVFLVDDIQFLQNRLNFEDEFCSTFETLINLKKQIVITSDKPPAQLKLSEKLVARMEWGLVAHVGVPDLETRVAILQHKSEQKNLKIPQSIAFFIAENIYGNVRQLEGAINKLTAYCRLTGHEITEHMVEDTLKELFLPPVKQKISFDAVLKSVATVFQIKTSDLRGTSRTKEISLARQVAMYLAKTLISDSISAIGKEFGKTHSTILYSCKTVEQKLKEDEGLKRYVQLCKRHIES
ncbi:MAG: chromosomal replication initiator protein DnaA [Victivallaceae bacterium]